VKKELWNRAKAFVFFESPVQMNLINGFFDVTHDHFQKEYPHWSYSATRKKVIFQFWSRQVSFHFGILLALGVSAVNIFGAASHIFILSLLFAAILSFLIIAVQIYWPAYFSDFLPKLDTIVAEKEKLKATELEMSKCKRSQFSTPTLTIIYYVNCKMTGIPHLPANDSSAELLNQLYGVDKDKIKQNLTRLCKISRLSVKEKAEMRKGIEYAREFFNKMESPKAQTFLDQLEFKLNQP
jgi:hypothetical protein